MSGAFFNVQLIGQEAEKERSDNQSLIKLTGQFMSRQFIDNFYNVC